MSNREKYAVSQQSIVLLSSPTYASGRMGCPLVCSIVMDGACLAVAPKELVPARSKSRGVPWKYLVVTVSQVLQEIRERPGKGWKPEGDYTLPIELLLLVEKHFFRVD